MDGDLAVTIAVIGAAGISAQWVAWRLGVPAIVLMLAAGLALGPGLGLLDPTATLGDLRAPAVGLAVAIIVFDGGLTLDIREWRAAGAGVRRLLLAVPLGWALAAAAAHWIGGIDWPVAVVFGAIMIITGPTVILPLLRQARLQHRPAAFLKWEGILNDPIGAVLAVVAMEWFVLSAGTASAGGEGERLAGDLLLRLGSGVVVGVATGLAPAYGIRALFHRDLAPEYLKTPILLAAVLGAFALADQVMHEAGLIAATVFGLALANIGVAGLEELKRFKESLTVFLVSGVFIILAADLDREVLARLSWPLLGTVLAVMLLVRPLAIGLATLGADLSGRERVLIAWIAPRGIVAAAMAGLAGGRMAEAGYGDADLLLPLVFAMIGATVVAHGFTIGPLARALGLAGRGREGVLIVGSWDFTIGLAMALRALDVPVIIADPDPRALAAARRAGLPTFRGDLLSERAEGVVELQDTAYLLAATADDAYNALLCARFASTMGRERVHQLAFRSGLEPGERTPTRDWRGKILLEAGAGHDSLR
ncbi:MAG: hypothetical protein RLY86_1548, partial [Pseudomonadota bacterium]